MPELSIVLTSHSREKQLLKTLSSFENYKYDFDVCIVDDSPEDLELPEYNFETTVLKVRGKNWINPAVNFNIGFESALKNNPQIIIIQNAECYHKGDIVGYALKNINEKNYLSFACYSLGQGEDVNLSKLNKRGAISNGDSAWYNHSRFRPKAFHFCTAITANNLRKINGFDERFALGQGYEDEYLLHQIKLLGLKIQIVDNPFVFHQYHYDVPAFQFEENLYNNTGRTCKAMEAEGKYRAIHYITKDF
jgi:GT2 family glycosyltransferase